MKEKIAVLSTCDTKGEETLYLKNQIIEFGGSPLVIDIGIKGEPVGIKPDIDHRQIARYIGLEIEDIQNVPTRGEAIDLMSKALSACLHTLMDQKLLCGVVCMAGASGASIVSSVMQSLPYTFPKLLVSPIASGVRQFGTFVGLSDMTVMHSVVDISGLNNLSRKIFSNVAGSIVGMSKAYLAEAERKHPAEKCIGITMNGQTTRGVIYAKNILEANGYTCLTFHGNGVGGPSMERLIKQNMFVGVLDYNLSEIVGNNIDGSTRCSPERLSIAGEYGLPQVVLPGSCDFINISPSDIETQKYKDRVIYNHSKWFPLARASKDESIVIAKAIAKQLNSSKGPVHVVLPLKGFSAVNFEDGPFWNKDTDDTLRTTLKQCLDPRIKVTEIDANINDRICGETAARILIELI